MASTTTSTPRPDVRSRTNVGRAGSAPLATKRVGCAEIDTEGDAGPERIDRDHTRCAHQARLRNVDDADRTDADDRNGVAFAEPAGPRHLRGQVEAVGDREQLGQHGDVGGQAVGNVEDRRARTQVEDTRPSHRTGAARPQHVSELP